MSDGEIVPKNLKRGKKPKSSGMSQGNVLKGKRARKNPKHDAAVDAAVDMEVDDDASIEVEGGEAVLPDRGLKVGAAVKKLIKGDVVSIETIRFDGQSQT